MATTSQFDLSTVSGKGWDTTDTTDAMSVFKLIDTIFTDYVSVIISLVGIPSNIVSCVVFWRQGLRDRVNLCLFTLSIVDFSVFLCIFITPTAHVLISSFDQLLGEEFLMTSMAYTLGVTYGLRAMSDVISMILAVDRCLCVLLPLHVTHLIRTRTMAAIMATSFVLLQLCYSSLTLKVTVTKIYVNSTESFEWKLVQTDIGLKYANILDTMFNTVLSISLPIINFVVVSTATAITVVKLRSATRRREKMSSTSSGSRDRQAGATKMLVLVSSLYIVSMAPYVAAIITRLAVHEFSPYNRSYALYSAVIAIADQVSVTNDAINVFVYFAYSSRFRQELLTVLRCKQRKHSTPSTVIED
ncbi:uncharacterized protein LOC112566957 [Pomacea canaliculata]|uniref:uncharacterized protein LOC112566957 n=1 Tax=Pomacea canaliculata TaxID=400727 RepID=UPI000D73DCED|nr:uncharacterized protein LOC112566957 [Pomacea canaliculata]